MRIADKTYVEQREKLIQIAERTANEAVGKERQPGLWNRVFHSTMQRFCYERGLIGYDPDQMPTRPVMESN